MIPDPSRVRKHADSTTNEACPHSSQGAKRVASLPIALLLISLTLPPCQSIRSSLHASLKNGIYSAEGADGGDV